MIHAGLPINCGKIGIVIIAADNLAVCAPYAGVGVLTHCKGERLCTRVENDLGDCSRRARRQLHTRKGGEQQEQREQNADGFTERCVCH